MRGANAFRRALPCVCTLIVAAFQAPFAAASVLSEDAPVPGGTVALARALAIDPVPDRGRFMFEITRLVYETADIRNPSVAAFLQSLRQPPKGRPSPPGLAAASDVVPVPLDADAWGDAIFHRRVTREDLVASIIADRQASLLCHGLELLDDETLDFFANHHGMLARLYERSAPIFAAFAGGIRVRDNRMLPPGGADAVPLWEAVVGEKVTRAERFIVTLFDANEGRLAYLYETIAQLDPPRRAFALGTWMASDAVRLERFRLLATSGLSGIREWHVRTLPFGRSSYDLGMALTRLAVADNGAPAPPAARGLWSRVFNGPEVAEDAPIDAAWLAETVVATDVRQRGERLDQVCFAQRVFGDSDRDRADVLFVVRSMPRFRALLLSFERMGVRKPSIYAAVLQHAAKLSGLEGRRGYVAQAQLQGSLVLLARMSAVGTFDLATVERLVERLAALPVDGNGYAGGVAKWLREDVHPALPPARDIEGAIVAALAGRAEDAAAARRVAWEGQRYRLDLAAAEHTRLRRVREKQSSPAIDVPLQLADAGRTLATDKASIDDLLDFATQFAALAADLPQRPREQEADNVPAGIALPPPLHDTLKKAADELTKAARNKDVKRAPRIAEPIVELADDLLARNLLSFAYAISLGDPEGTALLADDVSHRHDFGFGLKDGEMRARLVWAVPRTEVVPSVPWHVSGSLMALDLGLSTLALRRVATDHVLEAPKLTSNARDTFAASVSLLDPLALRDADRDTIAESIERGRQRVAGADTAQLDAIAADLGLDAPRHRLLRWTRAHDASRLASMLSLTELLALGGARLADLHAWGMGVVATNGCFCSRVLSPGAWRSLSGRPQLGLTAAVLPDVNFRVAMVLKELDLPAALAKVVLSAAMQDFIDEARPTDDGDWLSLSRTARAIARERIEDYVAAATATGPLMPDAGRTPDIVP